MSTLCEGGSAETSFIGVVPHPLPLQIRLALFPLFCTRDDDCVAVAAGDADRDRVARVIGGLPSRALTRPPSVVRRGEGARESVNGCPSPFAIAQGRGIADSGHSSGVISGGLFFVASPVLPPFDDAPRRHFIPESRRWQRSASERVAFRERGR